MKTLILIPIKNKETTVLKRLKEIEKNVPGMDYIFVDYGSSDRTRYLLANNNVNRLELPIEGTYEDSLSLGIEYAYKNGYDNVIQFDSFRGLNPNDINYFERTMKFKKPDFILGSRFIDKKPSHRIRHLHIRILKASIYLVSRKKVTDPSINFRMINKKVMKVIIDGEEWSLTPSSVAHLIKAKYSYVDLQISEPDKSIRQSSTKKWKLVKYVWYQMLTILFVQSFRRKGK